VLPYFILGLALLVGLLLAGRWFVNTEAKTVARVLKRMALALIVAVAVFFVVTGRLAWAFYTLPALLPWFLRFRAMARTAKNFSRMAAGAGGGGQTSDLKTRYLKMELDHDSGELDGEVIEGSFAGRRLGNLSLSELVDLLQTCWAEDGQSAQVLEAYLDRTHGDWREGAAKGKADSGTMSREEALQILGLENGASDADIKEAHHRLIAGHHPDRGGSTYLAAKINQAKDALLGN
jgi:hypothetical protein